MLKIESARFCIIKKIFKIIKEKLNPLELLTAANSFHVTLDVRMTESSSGAQDSLAVASPQSENAFACFKQALEWKQSNIGLNLRFNWLLYFIHIWIGVRNT